MKNWQKRLLTIAICEAWGMTTLALLLFGFGHDKGGNPYVILIKFLIALICAISCGFTMRIWEELFSSTVPSVSEAPVAFLMQFVVYAIVGLIISIVVCRKPEKY